MPPVSRGSSTGRRRLDLHASSVDEHVINLLVGSGAEVNEPGQQIDKLLGAESLHGRWALVRRTFAKHQTSANRASTMPASGVGCCRSRPRYAWPRDSRTRCHGTHPDCSSDASFPVDKMSRMSVIDDLERCFPGYRSPKRAAAWKAAKAQVPNDTSVTGVVVAKYPFGVFVDIGVGFPALLEIVFMDEMTPELYRDGKWSRSVVP